MSFLKEKSLSGVEVTGEKIYCVEPITEGLYSGQYRGYLANITDGSLYGTSSATHLISGSTGTRQNVIFNGVPVSGDISVDIINGTVYSPYSGTYYANYRAYEPIRTNNSNLKIDVIGYFSGAQTIQEVKIPYYGQYGYWDINVYGYPPSGAISLTVSNGTDTETMTMASGATQASGTFTNLFKASKGQTISVSGAASGAAGFAIYLWQV